jgi:hypothetical protein
VRLVSGRVDLYIPILLNKERKYHVRLRDSGLDWLTSFFLTDKRML